MPTLGETLVCLGIIVVCAPFIWVLMTAHEKR